MISTRNINVPTTALRALRVLEQAGYEAWIVGGFVRDALLDRPDNDIDIATDARWQQVQIVFQTAGFKTFETGVKHGTLTVQVDDDVFEVTTYRTDGSYSDARHPDSVTFVHNIDDDLARRDFTMNAIAYHPDRGLHDPFDGMRALRNRTICTVGDAQTRFGEDALRILRAVRFASQLGFSIERETAHGMKTTSDGLDRIAVERIRHELDCILCGTYVHDAIMDNVEVLSRVLPELLSMRNFNQQTPYHIYDVLEHTAYTVGYTHPEPLVRWAALCHDMGKPDVFFVDEQGQGHFYGHAKASADISTRLMRRMKMGPRFTADLLLLVRHHDTVVQPEPKQVKRMLRKLGGRTDLFRALCDLKRADSLAHAPGYTDGAQAAEKLEACLEHILQTAEPFSLKGLHIKGGDIVALGIAPGPLVGQLLDQVLNAVIDGEVQNDHDDLIAYVASVLDKTDDDCGCIDVEIR